MIRILLATLLLSPLTVQANTNELAINPEPVTHKRHIGAESIFLSNFGKPVAFGSVIGVSGGSTPLGEGWLTELGVYAGLGERPDGLLPILYLRRGYQWTNWRLSFFGAGALMEMENSTLPVLLGGLELEWLVRTSWAQLSVFGGVPLIYLVVPYVPYAGLRAEFIVGRFRPILATRVLFSDQGDATLLGSLGLRLTY